MDPMMMSKKQIREKLEIERETAEAKLKRKEKAIQFYIDEKRPSSEVSDLFEGYQPLFKELSDSHDAYAATLGYSEENWIKMRQQKFLMFQMTVRDYLLRNTVSSNPNDPVSCNPNDTVSCNPNDREMTGDLEKMSEELRAMSEELKAKRRTAQAKLTRKEKAIQFHIDEKRPSSEVSDILNEYLQLCKELSDSHDAYAVTVRHDDGFDKQEEWMTKRQLEFLTFQVAIKNYLANNPVSCN